MSITKKKAKRYCIVYGCLNSDRNEGISMFRLPVDIKRCKEWLALLKREDLLTKKHFYPPSYAVCEAHFEESSFKKGLKRGSTPIKVESNSPERSQVYYEIEIFPNTPIANFDIASVETQAEPCEQSDKETQTSKCLTTSTKRKHTGNRSDRN